MIAQSVKMLTKITRVSFLREGLSFSFMAIHRLVLGSTQVRIQRKVQNCHPVPNIYFLLKGFQQFLAILALVKEYLLTYVLEKGNIFHFNLGINDKTQCRGKCRFNKMLKEQIF
jgi:hypothetical protein